MNIRAAVLLDNNMVESSPTVYGRVSLTDDQSGDLIERLNDRLNDLETQLRLLQQPAGSVSWAKR